MRDDFAVMICSHGRAETMTTYDMLRKQGYTGRIIVVIDDVDDQKELYEARYECVEVFSKDDYSGTFDEVVIGNKSSVTFARMACFDIAANYGLSYFVELDDDLTAINYRYIKGDQLCGYTVKNLDEIFDSMISLFDNKNVMAVSFSKGSEFIGGVKASGMKNAFTRTCHSIFMMKAERKVKFISTLYEDMSTALHYGRIGKLFLGINPFQYVPKETGYGNVDGGASEMYKKFDDYSRCCGVVVTNPDCIKIRRKSDGSFGFNTKWDAVGAMILNERWKK